VGGAGLAPALNGIIPEIPIPPVAAFVVAFTVYWLAAKLSLQSRLLPLPQDS
jgi:high-affinity Fe2+/Pb2+ permease